MSFDSSRGPSRSLLSDDWGTNCQVVYGHIVLQFFQTCSALFEYRALKFQV